MARIKPVKGVYERPKGSGTWCIRYTVNGKDVRKVIGSLEEANGQAEKIRTLLRTGEGVVPDTAKRHARTTNEIKLLGNQVSINSLCDDLERYILSHPDQYKDRDNAKHRLAMVRRHFGHRSSDTVKPWEVVEWLDSFDVKPATKNRYKCVLSRVYSFAIERGKIECNNPARLVKQFKVRNGIIRFLKPDEERRIREVLQRDIDDAARYPQLQKHMIHRVCELDISLGTGMRKGEQYGLTWPDIDFEREVIVLQDSKNGAGREIPMTTTVLAAFKTLKSLRLKRKDREHGRPNPSAKNSCFALADNKRWWDAVLKDAKVTKYRWHDNRHTFCSRLAMRGVSLKAIAELAGHRSIQMTMRYAHLDNHSLKAAVKLLEAA